MTSSPALNQTKKGRATALRVLPLVIVPVAFLASLPWLKTAMGDTVVNLVAAAAAIFEMSYGNYLWFRSQRRLDEVQEASAKFAAQWGAPVGQTAFVVLIMLPPVQDLMTTLVNKVAGEPGMNVDRTVVVFAMTLGLIGVVLLQSIGACIVNALWWRSKP